MGQRKSSEDTVFTFHISKKMWTPAPYMFPWPPLWVIPEHWTMSKQALGTAECDYKIKHIFSNNNYFKIIIHCTFFLGYIVKRARRYHRGYIYTQPKFYLQHHIVTMDQKVQANRLPALHECLYLSQVP